MQSSARRILLAFAVAGSFWFARPARAHIETLPAFGIACRDGIDNDGDGFVDLADFGCVSALDASEAPGFQLSNRFRFWIDWRQFLRIPIPFDPDNCPPCGKIVIVDWPDLVGNPLSQVIQSLPEGFTARVKSVVARPPGIEGGDIPFEDSPDIPNLELVWSGQQPRSGPAELGEIVTRPGFTLPARFVYVGQALDVATGKPVRNVGRFEQQQSNGCSIRGNISYKGPGVAQPTNVSLDGVYREYGPFLSGNASNMEMQLKTSPGLPVSNAPAWMLGAGLHTMGFNEGPPTLSAVGDRGTITIDWGLCGRLVDNFRVTSVAPYDILHDLSGNLDLGSFAGLDPRATVTREVWTKFTATGATGALKLSATLADGAIRVLCLGQLVATYAQATPTVQLPTAFVSRLDFQAGDPDPEPNRRSFRGIRTRVEASLTPALSGLGAAAAGFGVLGAALVALRRRRRRS